jgi:WD40 repeat protein
LAFAPDGRLLAVAGRGKVALVETWTGTTTDIVDIGEPVDCLAFSRDGRMLAAAIAGEGIRIYDTATWTLWRDIRHDVWRRVGAVAFTRRSSLIAVVAHRVQFDVYIWPLG